MRWLLGTSFLLKSMLLAKGGLRAAGARPTVARQTTRMSSIALTTKRMAPTALLGATGLAAGREALRGWRTLRRPRWGFQAPKMVSTLTEPPSTEAPTHEAFTLLKTETLDEYGATCHLYEHKQSKAQVLSVIKPDDDNKVFGVTFRTPPSDSKGLPHILEHSVLCGSRQYPTKEPFVELLKGSLQTFLNAFTYPDRTCYPVASQNLEDFRNLARVYLDAVFHPRAAKDSTVLEQEGWHYEVEDDKLTYSGVVYNEMKGVYSSPDSLMARASQQALFPDNAYSVDSGGDPNDIPSLDFEQFQAFHGEFYHPGNARIFFYGDDDPAARLDLLEEYLCDFQERKIDSKVETQELTIKEPQYIKLGFPASSNDDEEGGQHMVSLNWLLTGGVLSPKDELGLAVLDMMLLGTSTSTLRKALTDSGLGESVIGGGLSDELVQPTYSVGMKGVAKDDVAKVQALILETLAKLSEEGFAADDLEASLNTMEFSLREFNTGSFPKGLSFMLGMMRNWIYERDPVDALRFEQPLADLKEELTKDANAYFGNLLKSLLVENTHRVTVEMTPDEHLEAAQKQEEEGRLAALRDEMSPAQLEAVAAKAARLKEIQNTPDSKEALASIPSLGLKDLGREPQDLPRVEGVVDGFKDTVLLTRELPTAGIIYADVALDLRGALDPEDLPLVPLFARMMQETGIAGKLDPTQLQRQLGAKTGGVGSSVSCSLKVPASGGVADPDDVVYRYIMRGKATHERAGDLFSLMSDILTHADFASSQTRVVEMLKESKARYESAFRTSGQSFASMRISAQLNRAGLISEATGGVSHYFKVLELLKQAHDDWPALLSTLEAMRSKMLARAPSATVVNLTGDQKALDAATAQLGAFCTQVFATGAPRDEPDWSSLKSLTAVKPNEAFSVPTQVNYVAKGGSLYAAGEMPSGANSVVSRFLSLDYLWNQVRVQGGAYGCSASSNPTSGTFVFSSYRDPNLKKTLDTYDGAASYLKELKVDEAELTKAIVAAIGDLDSPLTPDQKGRASLQHYLSGTTLEQRRKWRSEVLSASPADFARYGERLEKMATTSAVFASASGIAEANEAGAALVAEKLL